jgi:CBS domain-containing protein
MSRAVYTCHPDTSLAGVARMMRDRDTGFLPVTKSQNGEICGVVTDRDVCMAASTQSTSMSEIRVSSAMTADVHSCRGHDDLSDVHRIMRDHQIRRLPVLDSQRRPMGVISLNDLAIKAVAEGVGSKPNDVAHTLSDICRHRVIISP